MRSSTHLTIISKPISKIDSLYIKRGKFSSSGQESTTGSLEDYTSVTIQWEGLTLLNDIFDITMSERSVLEMGIGRDISSTESCNFRGER
jgi:hypothetical protein